MTFIPYLILHKSSWETFLFPNSFISIKCRFTANHLLRHFYSIWSSLTFYFLSWTVVYNKLSCWQIFLEKNDLFHFFHLYKMWLQWMVLLVFISIHILIWQLPCTSVARLPHVLESQTSCWHSRSPVVGLEIATLSTLKVFNLIILCFLIELDYLRILC